ncbi:MAG: sodium:phosphate symporter [Flavobacteriaceae bacterium CG18_big_fil_WC_8_21_14_2_50_34_36]|nr:MAG: sodium:phosphate symporter [Flavobacteriaceae bacterium CG18_big_fil_WC_8_21_14_2_50_34_36]PIZ07771.1 MAG: sodium:phosphate symporter [Flavobacteriaceae bacterium CG_4_10_14_0_8_um_filter_34_31]PJC08406.1 MAG: sodium:phosphate symporter [Flavobacteriaceae bacterium CG_4_9_14_0_8_um_filter_34_30]
MKEIPFDFWMFLAGLGIFLFGMRHLEDGIKGLAGKSFHRLIHRFTNRSWKGVLTGTLVTAILQSSSMVTLLVLAFLGAGMLSLKSALGVILGANLGTTITAWIVATLGFKMDIADFSFPFLAVGILSYLFLESRPILKNLGVFLIGFGLLFLGLDFMKDALDTMANQIDLSLFSQYGLWAFLVLGLIVTALIQSSSAMIVIILSALNAGLIDVYQSFAMIIGANIGTTSTLLLGSIKGTADKKRLALANVIFNSTIGILIFIFLRQVVDGIFVLLKFTDPLMELVLLNTLLNLGGILVFIPFLEPLQKLLKRSFHQSEPKGETLYIKNISTAFPEVALKAITDELHQVYLYVQDFIFNCFGIGINTNKSSGWISIFKTAVNWNEKYDKIKVIEDELSMFYAQLQEQNLTIKESQQLTSSMMTLRSLVYGVKDIKDVMHNIKFMMESEDELALEILNKLQVFVKMQMGIIHKCITDNQKEPKKLIKVLEQNETFYEETIFLLYQNIKQHNKKGVPVSTMTNVIKQTVSAMNNLCAIFNTGFDKNERLYSNQK